MTIANRTKKELKKAKGQMQAELTARCLNFIRQMEKAGALQQNRQSSSLLPEGGLEQLKLYSLIPSPQK